MSFLPLAVESCVALALAVPTATLAAAWKLLTNTSSALEEDGAIGFLENVFVAAQAAVFARIRFPRDLSVIRSSTESIGKVMVAVLADRVDTYISENGQYRGYWLLPHAKICKPDVATEFRAKSLTLVWLHGGGYTVGDARQDFGILSEVVDDVGARLGVEVSFRILSLKYPFAPENPYPAAVDHVSAAYEDLLKRIPAENVVLGGHSAGGGLALAVCQHLRALGIPRPHALLLCSPFVELSATAPSYTTNHARDSITANLVREFTRCYVGTADGSPDPMASPLRETCFRGYPRYACVYYGTREVLRDDVAAWIRKAREGNIAVEEVLVNGGIHMLPSSAKRKDIPRVVDFLVTVAASAGKGRSF